MIIYIGGDNGASAEGMLNGTPNEFTTFNGIPVPVKDQFLWYPFWGSDRTFPHFAAGWAWAMDTPFKWVKQVPSHFGGTAQGVAMSWPGHITDVGGIRRQFHHVIDIVPTILEATGIPQPEAINGIKQIPMEGVSMAYTWDKANANAPTKHPTQYFEMLGNRAIYKDGWVAATTPATKPWELSNKPPPDIMTGYNWELYNAGDLQKEDPTETNDLGAQNPDKLKQMQDAFYAEAAKYNVLPLDNTTLARWNSPRPNITAGRTEFVYTRPMTGLPQGDSPMLLDASYTITADITVPEGGAEGMILTSGGRFAGYGFYLLKGKPVFLWNMIDLKRVKWEGPDALAAGKHTLEFDFKYDGLGIGTLAFNNMSGLGRPGAGTLKVDGKEVQTINMEHTLPMILQWDESFDIGSDTLTGVNDADYLPPFPLTAKLNKLTIKVDRPQLSPEDIKKLEEATRNNKLSE